MRNVVFVAPFPIETTMRFVRAVSELDDVRLLGIVHTPPSGPDRNRYHDIVRVSDPLSMSDLSEATALLEKRHGQIDRLICILEGLQVPIAQLRERHGIEGTDVQTADLFRDKPRMKEKLSAAGIPVARFRLVHSVEHGVSFAEEVGFPMVLKPPAGMGAKATFRVSSVDALRRALEGLRVSEHNGVLCEEMLIGREFSLETITLGGVPQVFSGSHYLPTCLEVLEKDWIQWCCLLPRDLDSPLWDEGRGLATRAIAALGLKDGMTHMEWFQRPDGTVAIGEIAQRPPGANISLMTGIAHGIDAYRAWGRAVVDGKLDAPWERKFAVGCAFLRGTGHGRVASVNGVGAVHERLGHLVVEAKLPELGAPKSAHYEGDGYIVLKHTTTEAVQAALRAVIETVTVRYSGA